MPFTNRVVGYATAMLVAVLGTPSLAWEFNTPPVISPELSVPVLPVEGAPSLPPQPGPVPAEASTPAPAAPADAAAPLASSAAPVSRSLADLVGLHADAKTDDSEHECLANAVYFESKGEPLQGQLGVAEVVLNRARSGRFPTSLCGVVKQRGQFSFVRGGRLPAVSRSSPAWRKAVAIARVAIQDLADSPADRALFFHATRVKPGWRGLKRVATVGNHIFYR
jgi:spore germination cell wall hydrolase CwlJ-like protein